jgi:beta-glucosidase/6-phospho-beta-glucosidase/beta-galactosidase
MRQRVGDQLPKFSEKDRELIRNKIDFIGLNHYTSRYIANQPNPQPDEIHFYQVQQMERIGTMFQLSMTCLFFVCVYKKAQHNLKEAWLSVKTLVHRQRT